MPNAATEKNCSARILTAADKIPPFWIRNPELWFFHMENVFESENITSSKVKFQIIICNVQYDVLVHARDILKCPGDKPYENLKSRLVSTYLELETERIRHLLEGEHLDDKKPSQLLKLMIERAGYTIASGAIKKLWLNWLPQNIHSVLMISGLEDINKMAELADKLHEAFPSESIDEENQESSDCCPQEEDLIDESLAASLEAEINDLSRHIALINSKLRYYKRRYCGYSISRGILVNNDCSGCMCYYHFKFREKARKCVSPCSFWENINR